MKRGLSHEEARGLMLLAVDLAKQARDQSMKNVCRVAKNGASVSLCSLCTLFYAITGHISNVRLHCCR
jgi:hypothetical protein